MFQKQNPGNIDASASWISVEDVRGSCVQTSADWNWNLRNNTEIQSYTSSVFLLHQRTHTSFHITSSCQQLGCLWGEKGGKWNLSSLLCWIPENSDSRKKKKNGVTLVVSQRRSMLWMNFLFHSEHRYRVSPARPHAGSESHFFFFSRRRLQAAEASGRGVTGRGGGQISFWNFNLLQLNYLISEPPTSKEYLSCLLPRRRDGSFHSRLLEDSPVLYLYPAVWEKSEITDILR